MRSDFDFAPLYRATVGFDRVFDMLDTVAGQANGTGGGYPPYNIEKTGEDSYRIVMAVAGFSEAELSITQKEGELLVTGQSQPGAEAEKEYLYRGIAGRNFERHFQLADHVKVTGAKLANGLLTIDLQREIPEEKRPRSIPIANGTGGNTGSNTGAGARITQQ
jgi:molecular chaperone IbpA